MKKYKIKDNVDLKILKKYGFKLIKYVSIWDLESNIELGTTNIWRKTCIDFEHKMMMAVIIDEFNPIINEDNLKYVEDLIRDGLIEERNE